MNKGHEHINEPMLLHPAYFERILLEEKQAHDAGWVLAKPSAADQRSILSIAGDVATIKIGGVLKSSAPWFSWTEYTLYSEIVDAIADAEQSSASRIVVAIDSPGGDVAGVDIAANAIRQSKKSIVAIVDNLAASAAYWLASQANKIIAASPTARFGSIGVVARVTDWTKLEKDIGVVTHTIVSSKSPKKAPDVTTSEGRNQIRSELDDLLDVFVSRVARGRGVEKDYVYSDFGEGDVLIADKALAVGMIDDVLWNNSATKSQFAANAQPIYKSSAKENLMEKTYEDGLREGRDSGLEEGLRIGADEERARVTRLLGWMDTGASAIALDAIRSGDQESDLIGQLVRASHLPSEAVHRQAENVEEVDSSGFEASAETEQAEIDASVQAILGGSTEVRNV